MYEESNENTKDYSDKGDEHLSFLQDAPIFSEIDIVLGQDDSLIVYISKVHQHEINIHYRSYIGKIMSPP